LTLRTQRHKQIALLLVEDNPGDQRLIQEHLHETERPHFSTTVAESLAEAFRASEGNIDAILLDLNLPDSHGLTTLTRFLEHAPQMPCIVLTGLADEEMGLAAIQHGAHDYLTKDQLTPEMLRRAIVYAVERHHGQLAYQQMADIHRLTLENISDAVFITDDHGRFTYVCPNTHPIFGQSDAEIRALGSIDQLLGQQFIDDHPLHDRAEIANIEHQVTDRQGQQHDLLINVKRVDIYGGTTLYTCRDVSERVQAERELAASRQRLQAIFDGAMDAIVLTDDETRYVDVNPTACELLGCSRDELIGHSILEFLSENEQHEVDDILADFFEYGWREGEYQIARPDGTVRDVEYRTAGHIMPGLHLTLMRDITQRKAAERDLVESRHFTQSVLDSLDASIAVLDPDGWIIATNAKWDRFSQDNGEPDLSCTGIGQNYLDVCRNATGDHADEASDALQGIQAVLGGEETDFALEYPCPGPNDPDQWFLLHVAPFTGPQPGVVVAHLDITDRKRAEQSLAASERDYRLLFERNLAGVFKSTLDGRLLDCNEALVRILGYDSRDELRNMPSRQLYPDPDDRDRLAQRLQAEGELINMEVRLQRKDGQTIWALMNSSLYDEREGTMLLTGTCFDITERKRAQEQEAQLFDELEQAHQELRQAYDETIAGWAKALELKDKETEGHTQRVVDRTLELARRFDLSEEEIEHVYRGALLHDIGKMGVPDRILHKPGQLDGDEWAVIQQHPVHAYELLKSIDFLRPALAIPHCHHERWDGAGYPNGLEAENIPLEARIFAVVDAYDAMTSNRPYRDALPHDEAIRRLRENAGTQFDPDVVEAFVAMTNDAEA